MALFNRWKNTVEKLTHPVVQEEQNTEVATEDEASIFAKAFLECLTNLEHRLHGMKEPKEIGLSALAAACDFYDADWCGVLDVDVKLKLWMPFWWFDRKTGGMSATKIDEIGVVGIYERWMRWKITIRSSLIVLRISGMRTPANIIFSPSTIRKPFWQCLTIKRRKAS